MNQNEMFSKGFPTNRIPAKIPSTGKIVFMRETTIVELKSICKTIIDNFGKRQMDVIYDSVSEYLQSMFLTDDVSLKDLTEFDRIYLLMVFFQMSFYKEPVQVKCPHCGVEVMYRYDMSRYLMKMDEAFVEDQVVEIPYKSKMYEVTIGWPTVETMSMMTGYFYRDLGEVTEEMEKTQYGINLLLAFIKKVRISNRIVMEGNEITLDLMTIDNFQDRVTCINELPSMVVFDEENGLVGKIMGYFINRLENCFGSEVCPQCKKELEYGLAHASLFYSLFYGSLRGLFGFILQVEALLVFRYDCCIFDKEKYMTYNDLTNLVHQLSSSAEKENEERKKIGHDHLYKGLWYIREILNTLVFPQDKKK